MATPPSGCLVLVESTMGSSPPRLMLAPPGARLPPGVHFVEPAAMAALTATAAAGSGCSRATRLVAKAGHEPGTLTADESNRQKHEVLKAWEELELNGRAVACFGALTEFKESASRGILLVNTIMMHREYCTPDINAMEVAGLCFRRIALEAKHGYVRAATVVEAAQALHLIYRGTIARANKEEHLPQVPTALNKVPSAIPDPDAYFTEMSEELVKLIDMVESAFWTSF